MNVRQAIEFVLSEIREGYASEEALVDAKYLLSHVLDKNFTWLKTWSDKPLEAIQLSQLKELVARRKDGEPIAYILGQKHFWTLELKTNASTLIPRPETELLVEKSLGYLNQYSQASVLDLGTGTGAIALAIASERINDKILACDSQLEAVILAQENADKNQISNIKIVQSDWFSEIEQQSFQLIVSNPPYIDESDPHLSEGDLIYEPSSALISADNGLADIKEIVQQSRAFLSIDGGLMIEHGYQQGKSVRNIFSKNKYKNIVTYQDLASLERITFGQLN